MLWIRNNARLLLCSALAMALGLGAGVLIPREAVPPNPAETPEPVTRPAAQGGGPSILPGTEVRVEYVFAGCGHTVAVEGAESLHGLDAAGVTVLWPDAEVLELTGERARIRRERPGHCPDHYVLALTEEGRLTVTHTDENNPAEVTVSTLEYDPTGLPADVLAELREGIAFGSLAEINGYLEDVES